jgi:branched-chain amino acid transport system ATP-binding protein
VGDPEASSSSQPSWRRSPHSDWYRERGQQAALRIEGLNARYGASHVLFDVDLEVGAGETVALVGRNGAGKTTTLQCVMGMAGIARTGSSRSMGRRRSGCPRTGSRGWAWGWCRRAGGVREPDGGGEPARGGWDREACGLKESGSSNESAWPLERVFDVFPLLA